MKEVLNNNNNYKIKYWLAILYINGRKFMIVFSLQRLSKEFVGSWSRNLMARLLPWEQNGVPPIFNIMQIALAKCRSARGASHQTAFMGSCPTISHMCMPCLPIR